MVAGTLRVNLGGHYLSCKHAIPAMVETVGRGAIVNVASIQANRAYGGAPSTPPASPSIHPGPSELTDTSVTLVVSGYPAYAAAKAGIQGMSRNLALDYAASKIRVNVVSPGAVDTNMSGNSRKQACKACNT